MSRNPPLLSPFFLSFTSFVSIYSDGYFYNPWYILQLQYLEGFPFLSLCLHDSCNTWIKMVTNKNNISVENDFMNSLWVIANEQQIYSSFNTTKFCYKIFLMSCQMITF
jgi:hypothetical protein